MGRYQGKIVLVTGASSGIGAALAKEFARQGADVVLTARRKERLDALAQEIEAMGRRALAIACDVTKDEDFQRVVDETHEKLGKFDVVIANAGFGVEGRVDKLTVDDYKRQNETNLYGVLRTLYATIDDLKANEGRFAVVGSVMGHLSLPGSSPYAVSKYAVRALCEGIYLELRPQKVSVTLITPGFVATEIRQVNNAGEFKEHKKDPIPAWMMMSSEKAAQIIANGVYKRKREQIVTFHGRVAIWLRQYTPWFYWMLMRSGLVKGPRERKPTPPTP